MTVADTPLWSEQLRLPKLLTVHLCPPHVGSTQRVAVAEVTKGQEMEAGGKAVGSPAPGSQSIPQQSRGGGERLAEQGALEKVLRDESGHRSNGTLVCKKAEKRLHDLASDDRKPSR